MRKICPNFRTILHLYSVCLALYDIKYIKFLRSRRLICRIVCFFTSIITENMANFVKIAISAKTQICKKNLIKMADAKSSWTATIKSRLKLQLLNFLNLILVKEKPIQILCITLYYMNALVIKASPRYILKQMLHVSICFRFSS